MAALKKTSSFRGHFCEALVARNLQPKALLSELHQNVISHFFSCKAKGGSFERREKIL